MRIHIATDHAGLEFRTQLVASPRRAGHEVVDHGPVDYDPLDDYPAFCIRAAQAVVRDQEAGSTRSASSSADRATASRSPRTRCAASGRPWCGASPRPNSRASTTTRT